MNILQLRFLPILVLLALGSGVLHAHHGWAWLDEDEFELTGTVTGVSLGNPHGEVTLDANGEEWVVEVGQPWRNERAGLTRELLDKGRTITATGHRSEQSGERIMKAERVIIDGTHYDLYPDRL